jgi:carboxylesterase
MDEIGSADKRRIELENSFHVATLDFDAEFIFQKSLEFVRSQIIL